ncbi:MAG: hypothetical protein FWD11_02440 [Micrococcales bacterium]|nr:hypothetical protein [Micrococcales bacterium]
MKTRTALVLVVAAVTAGLSGCGVSLDKGNGSGAQTDGADFATGPSGPSPSGPSTPTGPSKESPAGPTSTPEYEHDDSSVTYHGPEGDFVIRSDHSIEVSFPDGASCSANTTGKVASTSGESEMSCEVKVHTFYDNQVEMTILDSAGKKVWNFESTWACPGETACPPIIQKYRPDGGIVYFP